MTELNKMSNRKNYFGALAGRALPRLSRRRCSQADRGGGAAGHERCCSAGFERCTGSGEGRAASGAQGIDQR